MCGIVFVTLCLVVASETAGGQLYRETVAALFRALFLGEMPTCRFAAEIIRIVEALNKGNTVWLTFNGVKYKTGRSLRGEGVGTAEKPNVTVRLWQPFPFIHRLEVTGWSTFYVVFKAKPPEFATYADYVMSLYTGKTITFDAQWMSLGHFLQALMPLMELLHRNGKLVKVRRIVHQSLFDDGIERAPSTLWTMFFFGGISYDPKSDVVTLFDPDATTPHEMTFRTRKGMLTISLDSLRKHPQFVEFWVETQAASLIGSGKSCTLHGEPHTDHFRLLEWLFPEQVLLKQGKRCFTVKFPRK